MRVDGSEAAGLRALQTSIASVDAELRLLEDRKRSLTAELARRAWQARGAAATAERGARNGAPWVPSPRPADGHEVGTEQIRNALLWLGTTLLALAALAFTAVAWTRLDDGGRAALLVGATVIAAGLAVVAHRGLRATSEALTGLAILLAVVDWFALRRAGVGAGVSSAAWWAAGALVVSGLAGVLGTVAGRRSARAATTVLLPLAATLTVITVCGAAWSLAIG
ncbi:MAG: hypothetical protein ACRDV7_11360, partial [Acidimicrobiia bacterium]